MLAQTIGKQFSVWRDSISRSLAAIGIGPNVVTVSGFVFMLLCGCAVGLRWTPVAVLLIVLAGACDMLDGAVARMTDRRTGFGALLDSTMDRYSDTVLYIGILFYFMESRTYIVLTVVAMAGSLATSYVRARAENLVHECRAGFWERAERVTYVLIGLTFGNLATVVVVLAVFTNLTVLQRLLYTRWELARAAGKSPWPPAGKWADLIFWEYDRGTWQYDAAVVVFFAIGVAVRLQQ
jgi:CDP-diacylglycerol--glycerol-3-phosphate 3-phosphatidyltransferase